MEAEDIFTLGKTWISAIIGIIAISISIISVVISIRAYRLTELSEIFKMRSLLIDRGRKSLKLCECESEVIKDIVKQELFDEDIRSSAEQILKEIGRRREKLAAFVDNLQKTKIRSGRLRQLFQTGLEFEEMNDETVNEIFEQCTQIKPLLEAKGIIKKHLKPDEIEKVKVYLYEARYRWLNY